MARVLVTDRIAEDGLEILRSEADVDVRLGISREELIDIIPSYQALVVRSETKVTADVLEACNLLVIGRAGVGVDNIDIEAATRRGAIVVNAPEGNTIAAAEHTIALMMALARHIPDAHASLSSGKWERSKFLGVELRGKTIGIIGLGRVGIEVARRARGLEMRVVGFDPFVSAERAQSLGVQLAGTKEELISESDFVTIHVPLNQANPVLIGEAEFKIARPGLRVINVSRGGQVDEEALLAALESGRVAGAAIDVFPEEPPPPDLPLLRHPRVLVTPHLGASTAEAQERVAVDVAHQILAVLRGEPAIYAVNMPYIPAETFKVIAPYLEAATQAASLATQLASGQIEGIEIEYLGELADVDVTPLKSAVIRGLLAPISEENVTLVNASLIAEQRGMKIVERKGDYEGIYKDLIRVHLSTSAGRTSISATVGHDGPHITEINDFWVDISPGQGHLLICENLDRPGMIGRIGSILGEKDINISFMRVGRDAERARALMVLGLDNDVDPDVAAEIVRIPNIFSARTARL
jgi:D-3-phosphoglycerate dehydrogenase